MKKEITAYISIGSNIGDRAQELRSSIDYLNEHDCVRVTKESSIYETAPVGVTDQPEFLNMVVEIHTSLRPLDLLAYTQSIEKRMGRERKEKWGPRTIDLDILLFSNENIELESLKVPHPRMNERGFVLIPLQEIAPGLRYPDGASIEADIHELTDKEGVRKWKSNFGGDV
ncbi:2-amino-4-hydroxy-6-hydroxymethyldihydropteridine diphosphokinase [Paenalkalicoccus suaedae]|uniref:2-amino-4-hydroxy-6-hydroxymethyldihydropteridine diphosphokinase n=1 Tax=Paenalkalicoccus suaedae TaxID=2592382 RepID=A0A859F9W6_9BACI|nr:2-amino-4-hydroxy-6-hydroxymethyldihydropteridine diphosphokinase [Paenalkalicoccus suaedae]QKS69667.1 2-amino-4-hydroxy-6-hydroxymethyldihydropteridine diphosphokinase [Paenalkalicoccus suaedae]